MEGDKWEYAHSQGPKGVTPEVSRANSEVATGREGRQPCRALHAVPNTGA